jgi:hypothetical protein
LIHIWRDRQYIIWHPDGPAYQGEMFGVRFVDGLVPGPVFGQLAGRMAAMGARYIEYVQGMTLEEWFPTAGHGPIPVFRVGANVVRTPELEAELGAEDRELQRLELARQAALSPQEDEAEPEEAPADVEGDVDLFMKAAAMSPALRLTPEMQRLRDAVTARVDAKGEPLTQEDIRELAADPPEAKDPGTPTEAESTAPATNLCSYSGLSAPELRAECKRRGLEGYDGRKRASMIAALEAADSAE